MKKTKALFLFKRIWSHLNIKRKNQIKLLLILLIFASFAEVVSIGMIFPFLGSLISPEKVLKYKLIKSVLLFFKIDNSHDLILFLTILFISVVIVSSLFRILLLWAQTKLSFAIGADLSYKIYRNTLFQPYEVHISRNSSEVISGILSKSSIIIQSALIPCFTIISSSIILLMLFFTLLFINLEIAISAIFIFTIIYVILIRISSKRIKLDSQIINSKSSSIIKSLQEGLGGIRDVLIDGTQDLYCKMYQNADLPARKSQANIAIVSGTPRFGIEAFGMIFISIAAYFLVNESDKKELVIPILGALALGAQRMLPILQQLYANWTAFSSGEFSISDALKLLDEEVPTTINHGYQESIVFKKSISMIDVSFKYSNESPWVLENLNFTIPKGTRVGIKGTTGSGKSTFLDILMYLLKPNKGNLYIDSIPITYKNYRSWQSMIAHVPQSIFLADVTILENIAFGIPKDQINFEKVLEASKKAKIADSIELMEHKYDTKVGERGIRLSGGQMQRIGIARALYKNAKIIIFDEATSALDNNTEIEVMNAIENLSDDLTIIIVAHRVSTLKNCDFIFELENNSMKLL
jgi:ABC-type multidrug transport system fused ATPase/permease subunit